MTTKEPHDDSGPDWASEEADVKRQLKTLEVAYALRTISRERFEDQRRRLERRLSDGDDGSP